MSEPVNDLPKQRIKTRKPVYVRQQKVNIPANNNNNISTADSNNDNNTAAEVSGPSITYSNVDDKVLLEKVELLHSFTGDTMNAIKNEEDQHPGSSGCPSRNDSAELLRILDDTHQHIRNNLLRGIHQKSRRSSVSSAGGFRVSPAQSDYDLDNENKFRKMKKVDDILMFKIDHVSKESIDNNQVDDVVTEVALLLPPPIVGMRESRSNPMLIELNQMKELEIIEEQENEQDNQSESGEGSTLLVQEGIETEKSK